MHLRSTGDEKMTRTSITRRSFLAGAAAMTTSAASAARLSSRKPRTSPNDKVNLAVVGAGGRGADNIHDLMETGAVNIVALCDCDERRAAQSFENHPDAKRY